MDREQQFRSEQSAIKFYCDTIRSHCEKALREHGRFRYRGNAITSWYGATFGGTPVTDASFTGAPVVRSRYAVAAIRYDASAKLSDFNGLTDLIGFVSRQLIDKATADGATDLGGLSVWFHPDGNNLNDGTWTVAVFVPLEPSTLGSHITV
jgi:hypothetical protein